MKIFLIDDHALFREGVCLILNQLEEQVEITEAENATQAIEIAEQANANEFDLVLMDLHLPDTTGYNLLTKLRELLPSVPLAVFSADENQQAITEALGSGATGFITKSSNSQVMISAIKLILSGGIYVPPAILNGGEIPTVNSASAASSAPTQTDGVNQSDIQITGRQQEVLEFMAQGLSNKEIAKQLEMSPSTVKVHVAAILRAFDATNRTQAVQFARNHNMVQ